MLHARLRGARSADERAADGMSLALPCFVRQPSCSRDFFRALKEACGWCGGSAVADWCLNGKNPSALRFFAAAARIHSVLS